MADGNCGGADTVRLDAIGLPTATMKVECNATIPSFFFSKTLPLPQTEFTLEVV